MSFCTVSLDRALEVHCTEDLSLFLIVVCRYIEEFFRGVRPRYEPVTYRVAHKRTNQISYHTLLLHEMA